MKEGKHKITLHEENYKRLMKLRISNLEYPEQIIKRLIDNAVTPEKIQEMIKNQIEKNLKEKVYEHLEYNIKI